MAVLRDECVVALVGYGARLLDDFVVVSRALAVQKRAHRARYADGVGDALDLLFAEIASAARLHFGQFAVRDEERRPVHDGAAEGAHPFQMQVRKVAAARVNTVVLRKAACRRSVGAFDALESRERLLECDARAALRHFHLEGRAESPRSHGKSADHLLGVGEEVSVHGHVVRFALAGIYPLGPASGLVERLGALLEDQDVAHHVRACDIGERFARKPDRAEQVRVSRDAPAERPRVGRVSVEQVA